MSIRVALWCASPLALLLLAAPARAQVLNSVPLTGPTILPESTTDEEPGEVQTDAAVDMTGEPLDLTTPEPGSNKLKAPGASAKPIASGWDGKAGVDRRKPSIPAADWLPDQLVAAQSRINPTGLPGRM